MSNLAFHEAEVQVWVRCPKWIWAIDWAANSLYPALIWWITDAQRLWCAILSSLYLFYLFPLFLTLSLLLSSLFPPPRSFLCIFTHPSHIHFICLFSEFLSHHIFSHSSLLSLLKSLCLSHPSGNKHCQVSLKGGVFVCVKCVGVWIKSFYLSPVQLFISQCVTKSSYSLDAASFHFKVKYMCILISRAKWICYPCGTFPTHKQKVNIE